MKAAVIGDFMLDVNVYCNVTRVSPEAPVPVALFESEEYFLGGAANVARNLSSLDVSVDFYSLLGNGYESIIQELFESENLNDCCFVDNKRPTTIKKRIISHNNQLLRIDEESVDSLPSYLESEVLKKFETKIIEYDFVIISDYAKGFLTDSITSSIIEMCRSCNIKTYVDPKSQNFEKYKGAYIIKPNESEASLACGFSALKHPKECLELLGKFSSSDLSIFTAGPNGVYFLDKSNQGIDNFENIPAQNISVFDVTGAGDTFIAVLAYTQALKYSVKESLQFAVKASSLVIQKMGCASVTKNEIFQMTFSGSSLIFSDVKDLKSELNSLKTAGKIVFTNGCFDLIHAGHIKYLEESKRLGDILVVGLNSDISVSSLKGKNRPINNQLNRAEVLASLKSVDYVIIFEELTPINILQVLRPNILTKGKDYDLKDVIGKEYVDEVVLIDIIPGLSTTSLVSKILN